MKKESREEAFRAGGTSLIFLGLGFIIGVNRNKYFWMAALLSVLLGIALISFRKKL
jgi:hypothetical protein